MRTGRSQLRARAAAGAVAAAAAFTLPATADAKPRWIEGQTVRSTVQACSSVTIGDPVYTAGVLAQTGFYADSKALPRVGQTFYARIFIGGAGAPCADQAASVEFVLPVGVTLAISAKAPIRCRSITPKTAAALTAAEGCPRRAQRARYGWQLARTTRADGLWALPRGQGYLLDVPLRSSRKLKGLAAGLPACGRVEFGPPCPPAKARDFLQVAVFVTDGNSNPWLVPQIGLFVR